MGLIKMTLWSDRQAYSTRVFLFTECDNAPPSSHGLYRIAQYKDFFSCASVFCKQHLHPPHNRSTLRVLLGEYAFEL